MSIDRRAGAAQFNAARRIRIAHLQDVVLHRSGAIVLACLAWFSIQETSGLSNLVGLIAAQIACLEWLCPKSRGKQRVDERRVVRGTSCGRSMCCCRRASRWPKRCVRSGIGHGPAVGSRACANAAGPEGPRSVTSVSCPASCLQNTRRRADSCTTAGRAAVCDPRVQAASATPPAVAPRHRVQHDLRCTTPSEQFTSGVSRSGFSTHL
jgi:hypothetical protein